MATATAGLAIAVFVAVFAGKGDHPTARMARCLMGFCIAIGWIMAIADKVINVLQLPFLSFPFSLCQNETA